MKKLLVFGICMLMASPALAVLQETVSFVNVPSQGGSGMVSYNMPVVGGYNMGNLDWDGYASVINAGTYGSELTLDISGPLGAATITLGSGTSYSPGAAFAGVSSAFDGAGDPAGAWTFDFYETYDDGGDGMPDATWDNIDFGFYDWVPGPTYLFMEDFEGGIPADWTLVDNLGNGGWLLNTDYGNPNYTPGSGLCADIDSDEIGSVDVDAEMITHLFTVPASAATLEFDNEFNWYSGGNDEKGDVDIWTSARGWTNLLRFQGEDVQYTHESVDLSAYAGEEAQIRFHYYDANYEMRWQVDNVGVTPEPMTLTMLALGGLALMRRRR